MKTLINDEECITCEFSYITKKGIVCRIGNIPDSSSFCDFRKEIVRPRLKKKGGKYAKGRKRYSKSFGTNFQKNP